MADDRLQDQEFQAKLESYREANLYGRSIYDNFYRHAGISFTFNAVLITAAGFLFDEDFSGDLGCRGIFIFGLALLGSVYNLGAVFAYRKTMHIFLRLNRLIHTEELMTPGFLQVQKTINPFIEPGVFEEAGNEGDGGKSDDGSDSPVSDKQKVSADKPAGVSDGWVYYLTLAFFGILIAAWVLVILVTFAVEGAAMWGCVKNIWT